MRPSTRKWMLIALAGVLFYAAHFAVAPINTVREQRKLVLPPAPDTGQTSLLLQPLLALGRAPLVDYLWMRASKLKDEGRFFDAYQLSSMICELQPKFASVWGFQGWNMAYNISVTLKSPEERWRWVRNGYELIRDKGIPLNPNSTQLYRELSWILFHKVGDFMDEMHFYYKLQFALIMEEILGPPPEGFVQPGRVPGDYYRAYPFQALADAPQSWPELLKLPGVAEFVNTLKAFHFDAAKNGVYLNLIKNLRDEADAATEPPSEAPRPQARVVIPDVQAGEQENKLRELRALMSDPVTADARRNIEHYWRAYRLRNEVKLDPDRILELQKGFGVSIDFRLPEAHSLYWANMGIEKGVDNLARLDIHRLNTNRIEFFCLQKMFQRGRMTMSKGKHMGEPPLLAPDIRIAPVLREAFLRDSKEYLKEEKQKTPVSENFKTTFISFMRTAILRYHELGMQKEAREYFDYLKEHFPDPMYEKGIDGFLALQFKQDRELNDYRIALARVRALLGRAYIQFAYDEDEEAARFMTRARQVYDIYHRDVVSKRQVLIAFPEIIKETLHEFGGQMYRESYLRVCKKLGVEPLPEGATTTSPAS